MSHTVSNRMSSWARVYIIKLMTGVFALKSSSVPENTTVESAETLEPPPLELILLRGFEILMQKIFEGDLSCDCIWSISYNLRKSWAALTVDLNCGNFFKCSFFKILILYLHQYQNYERHNDETFSANGPWQMWFSWWFHAEDLSVSIFMIIIRAVLRRFCQ